MESSLKEGIQSGGAIVHLEKGERKGRRDRPLPSKRRETSEHFLVEFFLSQSGRKEGGGSEGKNNFRGISQDSQHNV